MVLLFGLGRSERIALDAAPFRQPSREARGEAVHYQEILGVVYREVPTCTGLAYFIYIIKMPTARTYFANTSLSIFRLNAGFKRYYFLALHYSS
jgi:hypothetical protein